jgi:hypothetical protein
MLMGNLVSSAGRSTAAVFDRSALDLEGYWPAVYTNASWSGAASGGASSGRNLAEATNFPTRVADILGTGHDVADFDGTNDHLDGAACSTFLTTTQYSGWALVYITAINTNNTSNYALNDTIVGTNGTAEVYLYLRSNGGAPVVGIGHGGGVGAETSISLNTWHLVQFRFTAGQKEIRINRGSWVTHTGGSISGLTATLKVGDLASNFYEGRMGEIALSKQFFDNTDFDGVCDSIESSYTVILP